MDSEPPPDPGRFIDDPRLVNLERPALWQALSDRQVFLVSPWTARIKGGPAATVSTAVPDKHYFRGSFGGKDVLPLYRDAAGAQPNITRGLLDLLAERLGVPVSPEDFLAYCYAVLAHPGYTETFSEPLEAGPVRVPLTSDLDLFRQGVELGSHLLWLHTYGTRYTSDDRPAHYVPRREGLEWAKPVTAIPATPRALKYDPHTHHLSVGDGLVTGVLPEAREFAVSGMNILDKWLGARTAKGIGRAASQSATPLDKIRPEEWEDEWNDELLDLLRVLTATVESHPEQAKLLASVLDGSTIDSSELPVPTKGERTAPATINRDLSQETLSCRLAEVIRPITGGTTIALASSADNCGFRQVCRLRADTPRLARSPTSPVPAR